VVVAPQWIITSHRLPSAFVSEARAILTRVQCASLDASVAVQALLIPHCNQLQTSINSVRSEVQGLDKNVPQSPQPEQCRLVLEEIKDLRQRLSVLMHSLAATESFLAQLSLLLVQNGRGCVFQALVNALSSARLSVELTTDLLSNLTTSYLALVSVSLADIARVSATTMKHVNAIYVIGQSTSSLHWFFGVVTLKLTLIVLLCLLMWRFDWL